MVGRVAGTDVLLLTRIFNMLLLRDYFINPARISSLGELWKFVEQIRRRDPPPSPHRTCGFKILDI